MADLYRSQPMEYVSITTTTESAGLFVKELGELAIVHVVDLSSNDNVTKEHQLHKKMVIECGTWERKLETLHQQMLKYHINVPPVEEGRDVPGLNDVLTGVQEFVRPLEQSFMANLNFMTENKQAILRNEEWIATLQACKKARFMGQREYRDQDPRKGRHDDEESEESSVSSLSGETKAISALKGVFQSTPSPNKSFSSSGSAEVVDYEDEKGESLDKPLLGSIYSSQVTLQMEMEESRQSSSFRSNISGTIPLVSRSVFHRALYRISRGNAIVTFHEISNSGKWSIDGDEVISKSVFNVMVIGKQLADRVRRVCSSYDANIYKCPQTRSEFDQWITFKHNENADKRSVLEKSRYQLIRVLEQLAWSHEGGRSPLRNWQLALRKEKGIHATLMKAHRTQNLLCIEGWVPVKEVERVRDSLHRVFQSSSHPAPHFEIDPQNPLASKESPPTYFETGEIVGSFQAIVDTYGVPRYQEANPGLFTVITFPFLFGVMYGDVGHGTFLTLFALFLCSQEKSLGPKARRGELNELIALPYAGRYMMVLMGLFAIYNGFIYNDCMAMPIFAFPSMWNRDEVVNGSMARVMEFDGSPRVYPFGSDPNWYDSANELEYFNSLKMKISVILGVTQMTFGILLGATNHVFFKDKLSLYFEWIPQILFLSFTFGYMCFLIVLKWCTDWSLVHNTYNMPPSILQTMLKFFLAPGTVEPGMELYPGQAGVQAFLLLCAVIAVPVMLLVKPLVLRARMRRVHFSSIGQHDPIGAFDDHSINGFKEEEGHTQGGQHEQHSFGDIMVHQIIHTIEFVLGAVSNTASYLRLWALSLAHSQLAKVFWNKVFIELGLQKSGFMTFIAFAAWFGATFFVLLCMDSLECFLHALRLHWVEFQNKFYAADGYPFVPFNFEEKIRD